MLTAGTGMQVDMRGGHLNCFHRGSLDLPEQTEEIIKKVGLKEKIEIYFETAGC